MSPSTIFELYIKVIIWTLFPDDLNIKLSFVNLCGGLTFLSLLVWTILSVDKTTINSQGENKTKKYKVKHEYKGGKVYNCKYVKLRKLSRNLLYEIHFFKVISEAVQDWEFLRLGSKLFHVDSMPILRCQFDLHF